ncbi:MAG: hypothetical protein ACLFV8_11365 [Alphaproteobacteria bacterium]
MAVNQAAAEAMETLKLISYGFWGAAIFMGALLWADAAGLARHVAYDSDGPATLLVLMILFTALFTGFHALMQELVEGDFEG